MYRFCLLIIICLLLVGCNSTKSFFGSLDGVNGNRLLINCTNEINKGKKNIDDIGYLCDVEVNEKTRITNSNGEVISIEDIPINSILQIHLNKSVNLRDKRNELIAEKVDVLT